MFDKKDYIIEKILSRLQNVLSLSQIQDCKALLQKLSNLDLVNQPSDTFENSKVGWLTIAKILETIASSNAQISLDSVIAEYPLQQKIKTITREYDIIDNSAFSDETDLEKVKRILLEHGEENYCDDFFEDELTEEGLRQASYLDTLSSSFDGEYLVPEEKIPVVTVSKNQEIVSPWGNTEIFQISSNVFLDIELNQEFKIRQI